MRVQPLRALTDAQTIFGAQNNEQQKRRDLATQTGDHDVDTHVTFHAIIGSCSDSSACGLQHEGAVIVVISLWFAHHRLIYLHKVTGNENDRI